MTILHQKQQQIYCLINNLICRALADAVVDGRGIATEGQDQPAPQDANEESIVIEAEEPEENQSEEE